MDMDIATHDKLTIETVKRVAPCVVSVAVSKYLPRLRDISPADLFNPFVMGDEEDGAGQKVKVGGGSGFIAHPDGIILTKLDSSAKGGIVVAIRQTLGIPVRYIGVGEQLDDFARFSAPEFVDALLGS